MNPDYIESDSTTPLSSGDIRFSDCFVYIAKLFLWLLFALFVLVDGWHYLNGDYPLKVKILTLPLMVVGAFLLWLCLHCLQRGLWGYLLFFVSGLFCLCILM